MTASFRAKSWRAPWLTQVYNKNPAATAVLWEGGYLHTQDIGTIDDAGYLQITDRTNGERRFLDGLLDVDLAVLRPLTELPVQTVEFDRQEKIDAAYQQGLDDAARGWERYTPSTA